VFLTFVICLVGVGCGVIYGGFGQKEKKIKTKKKKKKK
jgi:putative Mn2+ efflux pump MntP